jgi:hypothetical protein
VVPIRVTASGQEIHYRMRRTTPFLRIYDSFALVRPVFQRERRGAPVIERQLIGDPFLVLYLIT